MGACGASSRDELKQKEGSPVLPDLSFELPIRSGLEHMPTWISPVRHLLQKCHFSETDLSAKSRPEQLSGCFPSVTRVCKCSGLSSDQL